MPKLNDLGKKSEELRRSAEQTAQEAEKLNQKRKPRPPAYPKGSTEEYMQNIGRIGKTIDTQDQKDLQAKRLKKLEQQRDKIRKDNLQNRVVIEQQMLGRLDQLHQDARTLSKRSSISATDQREFANNALGIATDIISYAQATHPDLDNLQQKGGDLKDLAKQFKKTTTTKESKGLLGSIKDCLKGIIEFIKETLGLTENKKTHHQERVTNRSAERIGSRNF
jgi:hypothetical protein